MSGHSKWASIKHAKGAADAKRGKVFTKLGHNVTIAARLGGGDASLNPRLALAIEMAKKSNMPKENIDRAIKRGTGDGGGPAAEEVIYEGYGPGGTAIIIEGLTDNKNRTIGEIRSVFNKYGGKLGESGSVAYLFKQQGVITVGPSDDGIERVEMAIIESGAEDYTVTNGGFIVYTDPKALMSTKQALEEANLTIEGAEQKYEPRQIIKITDEKIASQILRVMNTLEELEDISVVVSNFDISAELLSTLSQEA